MYIVGFDGLVRAGKTTLLKERLAPLLNALIIDEYGVYARKLVSLPKFPPVSYEEAINASEFFVDIEKQRVEDMRKMSDQELILVDRTHLSCLGFDYAARHFTGFDTFNEVKSLWEKTIKIEADLIVFLDVSHKKLEERIAPHKDKFSPHFYDETFNRYISEFLRMECEQNPRFIRVNADPIQDEVQAEVLRIIQLHRFGMS